MQSAYINTLRIVNYIPTNVNDLTLQCHIVGKSVKGVLKPINELPMNALLNIEYTNMTLPGL